MHQRVHPSPTDINDDAVRRVLLLTLGLNLAVALAKIVVGSLNNALSVEADGYHSLTDGLNNIVALVGVALASRPPDENHPYGHRKFEVFAATIIGLSLLFMAFEVAADGIARLRGTSAPPNIDVVLLSTLLVTLFVNVAVATYEARAARRYKSELLMSDATHTQSDVIVTLGVFLSSLLVRSGYIVVDTIAAFFIAAFIAAAGINVLRRNLHALADAAPVDAALVQRAALSVDGVRSAHHVRSRGAVGHVFIDLHIEVDGDLTLDAAHLLTHAAMDAIRGAIDGVSDVTIHTEPRLKDPLAHDAFAHGPAPTP